jgi:catechol 2,3-dioxygenase-like lactoylglutathione lyase family enzyme
MFERRSGVADQGDNMITHVNVAVMYVADQERSREFYVDKLGFEVVRDEEMWPGARWLEVAPRGAQTAIVLSSAADFGKRPGEGAYLTFACDDIQATFRQLGEAGVKVTDPVTEPWGAYIKATDPDGNEVMIVQKAPRN